VRRPYSEFHHRRGDPQLAVVRSHVGGSQPLESLVVLLRDAKLDLPVESISGHDAAFSAASGCAVKQAEK